MTAKTSVLKELEKLFAGTDNRICVFYGRSGSEKEALIKAFLKGKKFFYYRARSASADSQRAMIGKEIESCFDMTINKKEYEEYFKRVRSGDPSKLVLVFDEAQLIMKRDPAFWDAVLKLKKKKLYPGPVMILLCSSSVVWAEQELEELLQEQHRNIDKKIKIEDLNFLEVVRAFPNFPVSECIKVYGILGGVASYINRWDGKADVKTNICRHVLSPDGYLFSAAEDLIAGELRELSVYETILAEIASGNDKLNGLYQKTGFSRAKISVYMKNLAAFDIIEKVQSFETGGWENAKKGVYRIRDHFVDFWFRFIYPHYSDLFLMSAEKFYAAYIDPGLDSYMRRYFVQVCMEYMDLLNRVNKLPLKVTKMGTWVGKEGCIDIIAQNEIRENIVGSCNWSEPEFSLEMCDALFLSLDQARVKADYFFFFSAKGFAPALVAQSKVADSHVVLIDMNSL